MGFSQWRARWGLPGRWAHRMCTQGPGTQSRVASCRQRVPTVKAPGRFSRWKSWSCGQIGGEERTLDHRQKVWTHSARKESVESFSRRGTAWSGVCRNGGKVNFSSLHWAIFSKRALAICQGFQAEGVTSEGQAGRCFQLPTVLTGLFLLSSHYL